MTRRVAVLACAMWIGPACNEREHATLQTAPQRNEAVAVASADSAEPVVPEGAAVSPGTRPQGGGGGGGGDCAADADACVRQGVALTRTDLPRAAQLFDAACETGSAAGCGNLGVMLRDARGIPADPDRARSLLRRACTSGHRRSCTELRAP